MLIHYLTVDIKPYQTQILVFYSDVLSDYSPACGDPGLGTKTNVGPLIELRSYVIPRYFYKI